MAPQVIMTTILGRLCAALLLVGAPVLLGAGCDGSDSTTDTGAGASGQGGAGQGGAGGGAGQGGAGQGGAGGGGDACADGEKNGAETDVDCGGGQCAPCASGQGCGAGADCASGLCTAGTCTDVLLVSEIRTRGQIGGTDEFLELYNPSEIAVTVGSSWRIEVRDATGGSCESNAYVTIWAGEDQVIPAHGHLLIASTGYNQEPAPDSEYTQGNLLPDAGSVRLMRDVDVVDAVCFYYNDSTLACVQTHTCEGNPVENPHTNGPSSNVDASLERKPGGDMGSGADTGNNAMDFAPVAPSRPESLTSPPAPASNLVP